VTSCRHEHRLRRVGDARCDHPDHLLRVANGSLGNAIGKFVYSFKKASKGDDFIEVKPSSKLHGNNAPIEDAHVIDENKRT